MVKLWACSEQPMPSLKLEADAKIVEAKIGGLRKTTVDPHRRLNVFDATPRKFSLSKSGFSALGVLAL